MSGTLTTTRSRTRGTEGYLTPTIEDGDHPLNLWRSRQENGTAVTSYFPDTANMRLRQDSLEPLADDGAPLNKVESTVLHLPWRERLKHTTWAYFTMTMATGGIANVLHSIPFRSDWLEVVGLIYFFLNLALFITICAMIATRFISYPYMFRASFTHPTEGLFVAAFAVSFGTILITIVEYGASHTGVWLTKAVQILFWFDVAISVILSVTIYLILWSSLTFTIAQMTPIWIFPAYPLLIIGPHAANLVVRLTNHQAALEVVVGGFTVQGIGFLVSLTIYSAFVYRLMTQKLPADPLRPGMFVSVGPAAFTCSGTIGMASALPDILGQEDSGVFMGVPSKLAGQILMLAGNWMSLWLWGLALWFFCVSVVSNLAPLYTHKNHKIPFAMTWYSYIFPQTALTTATFRVADAFSIHPLKIIGCVMAGLLVVMWFFVVGMMIRAIYLKQILWPDKGEDKDEGGFVRGTNLAKTDTRRTDPESGRRRPRQRANSEGEQPQANRP